jgi:hypothetical protein
MTGCLAKPRQPAFQPRSRAGWYAGSLSAGQRLVGLVIPWVQPAYQRMHFVQGWRIKGCLAAGGRQACVFTGGQRQAGRGQPCAQIDTLAPPPLRTACGAHPEIFPSFSTTMM